MVAYSFKKQFAPQIVAGTKCQTIRGNRKRHAHPGEGIQLYYGMRTKHCRKLLDPDPECISVEPISLFIEPQGHAPLRGIKSRYRIGDGEVQELTDGFAQADGFLHAKDMVRFWLENHGAGRFDGVLIKWDPEMIVVPLMTVTLRVSASELKKGKAQRGAA